MKRSFFGVIIIIPVVACLLSCCSTPEYRFQVYTPSPDPVKKVSMTLTLVLPPSVCSYAEAVGDIRPIVFYVGETICRNIEDAARLNYQAVKILGKAEDALTEDADALLNIEMIGIKNYMNNDIPLLVGYNTDIEWSFSTRDGESKYIWKLRGNGEDQRSLGYVFPRHRDSLQRCMDNLGRKVNEEMAVSLEKGRKNVKTIRDILAKFEKYEIGITSLDEYEKDQTADWKVEFVNEIIKAKKFDEDGIKSELGYIRSPDGEALTHESFGKEGRGATKTFSPTDKMHSACGENQVCVLEFFYSKRKKSEAKIIESEYYIKDNVHSAYGENLICSVEFYGKGKGSYKKLLHSFSCIKNGEDVLSKGNPMKIKVMELPHKKLTPKTNLNEVFKWKNKRPQKDKSLQ